MGNITLIAILGITSTFTMFAALVRQTIRAERAERRLELIYAMARASGRHDIADAVGEERS
jgi:hypothetical protein